jgi:hypothetical protein
MEVTRARKLVCGKVLNVANISWKNESPVEVLLPYFVGKLREKNAVAMPCAEDLWCLQN